MSERQESEGRIESIGFEEFFARSERPIRFALSARFGFEVGREATADALTHAWEHWDRIAAMSNPAGYVYRVGQRLARRSVRRSEPIDFSRSHSDTPLTEPKLAPALASLTARQRTIVVLVHGLGWTHREAAEFLGLTASSVQKHVERGIAKLRTALGVEFEN